MCQSATTAEQNYFANNCILCERKSPTGMHLTCCILTHLSNPETPSGWVSLTTLIDAVGRTEFHTADQQRVYGAIRRLRQRGHKIVQSIGGYRWDRSA